MRTLTNPLKCMSAIEIFRILAKHTLYPTTLCSFWRNFSGHFARLTCNHSYGYAHCLILMGPIEQTDSLTGFIKYTPLSAFSCNMRARAYTAQPSCGKCRVARNVVPDFQSMLITAGFVGILAVLQFSTAHCQISVTAASASPDGGC